MSLTLGNARVLSDDGDLVDGWIRVAGDTIELIGTGTTGAPDTPHAADVDLAGAIVLPGFIDQHCHGGGGAAFTSADDGEISTVIMTHRRHGTTTMNASLVTATYVDLVKQIRALIPYVDDGSLNGIHLEGPWISHAYCGAHDPDLLRNPDPDDVSRILEAGDGRIAMVTIAPELPGAMESIERIVASGAVAAVGHTGADDPITTEAIERGATVATHLFNAMPPLLHRDPGPIGALLNDDRVTVEIICDLVHVAGDVIAIALASSHGRTAFISDAMAAAGAPDGPYRIGLLDVDVTDGQARLTGTSALAGSTLLLDQALRNGVLIGQPLHSVSACLSAAPALAMGLSDRGHLAAGQRADLVVLDDDLRLTRVMRNGAWLALS